jgi:predicted nucleic acid-binding Zn ribbon protein
VCERNNQIVTCERCGAKINKSIDVKVIKISGWHELTSHYYERQVKVCKNCAVAIREFCNPIPES